MFISVATSRLKQVGRTMLPPKIIKKINKNEWLNRMFYRLKARLFIIRNLKRQLSVKNNIKYSSTDSPKKILFPLVETSHYQIFQLLIVAKLLQLRGSDVLILTCGGVLEGCEIKSIVNENSKDPCWKCLYNERNVLPLFKLKTVEISSLLDEKTKMEIKLESLNYIDKKSEIIKNDINFNITIDDSVTRYFYGALPDNLGKIKQVRLAHTKTLLTNVYLIEKLNSEWSPDIVVSNMTSYSIWEPYYKYYVKSNKFIKLSMTEFDLNSMVFSSFELFPAKIRFEEYLKNRVSTSLNNKENNVLNSFIMNRKSGKSKIFIRNSYFKKNNPEKTIRDKLMYNKNKKNIFLFSNLFYDVGLSESGRLFPSVIEWVKSTVGLLKDKKDIHLYIKPHPAELSSGSLRGISDVVNDNFELRGSNITIIKPEWQINTYKLFPLIDLGIVHTGTLGLEMMLDGIPIVTTGITPFFDLGFSLEPKSIDEYNKYLVKKSNVEKEVVTKFNTIRMFAYFYFIKNCIPWNVTNSVHGDEFYNYLFSSINELNLDKSNNIHHIINCILHRENNIPEGW